MNKHIEYEVKGSGIPFVFIHGLGGDMNQIESAYDPIDGVQLININMQGHGNTLANYETLDFNTMADDVIQVLHHLQIQQAIFGGISMGAAIAMNIAIRYPKYVNKLILVRPAWTHKPMSKEVQTAYTSLADALQQQNKTMFLESEGWKIVNQTTDYTRNTFLHTFEEPINVKEWQKFNILPFKTPYNSIVELENLDVYTSIIACRNDFVHPYEYAEYYHKHLKNSVLVEIPSKDIDSKKHREMMNQEIYKAIKK
ncbi:MAG: alpha/beta hydrolase [Erysipelotrichaceae bacterium]|nr:alpha/beta hydrolase [Erysipelotrichaceae bacterium]